MSRIRIEQLNDEIIPGETSAVLALDRWVFVLFVALSLLTIVFGIAVIWPLLSALNEEQVKRLGIAWRIAAVLGTAAGVVLGWLVIHRQKLVQQLQAHVLQLAVIKETDRLKRISDEEQDRRNKEAEDRETKRQKEAEEREAIRVEQAAEREAKRQEEAAEREAKRAEEAAERDAKRALELEQTRSILSHSEAVAKIQAEQEAQIEHQKSTARKAALQELEKACAKIQTRFGDLIKNSYIHEASDLARSIQIALEARSQLQTAQQKIKEAYGIVGEGYSYLLRKYDATLMTIIAEVNPKGRGFDAGDKRRREILISKLKFQSHYLASVIEFRMHPREFREIRKDRIARIIMRDSELEVPRRP